MPGTKVISYMYLYGSAIVADTVTPAAGAAASPNRGVKRGLPTVGLVTAESSAKSLWTAARRGTTSKEAFAKQLGWSRASGSHWETRLALLRGFKLLRFEKDQIGLSDVGLELVNDSDPDKQSAARRAALMNLKAYRDLVVNFEGTELPEVFVLASRLQFDYGKTEEFAQKAADAFVESLRHANMLDASNIVRREGAPVTDTARVDPDDPPAETDEEDDAELDRAFDVQEREPTRDLSSDQGNLAAVQTPGVTLSIAVTLDLSKYRADEVIQILQALGSASRD